MTTSLDERIAKLTPRQRELLKKRTEAMKKLSEVRKFVLTLREGDQAQCRPIFTFHPPIGAVGYMINLVRHLSKDQPFYGVQCPAYEGVREPFDNMKEMADYYLKAIRLIQPEGPYLLMGHSSGAYIAYEMALQLQAQGLEAPLVMVIDEVAPCLTGNEPEQSIMDVLRAENVHESVEAMFVTAWLVGLAHGKKLTFTADELGPLPNDKRYELVANFLKHAGFIPENAKPEIVGTILEMYRNHSRADDAYKDKFTKQPPNPLYNGQLVLFRCTEPTTYEGTEAVTPPDTSAYSSWDKFCSKPVDVIGIPNANHITIIMEPCVKVMANQIERYLRRFAKIA